MRKIQLLLIIVPVLFVSFIGCQKKSVYYSSKEKQMLKTITESINFSYGFDADVELDYVFPKRDQFAKKEFIKQGLKKSLKQYKSEEVIAFYETMYRLSCMHEMKIAEYKKREKWSLYTHMKKYLYPPLKMFIEALEDEVIAANPEYKEKISARKKTIKNSLKKKDNIIKIEKKKTAGKPDTKKEK